MFFKIFSISLLFIAKLTPASMSASLVYMASTIPINSPEELNKGAPESPGLTAASI